MWWKASHPFVRHVRYTEALSTLPISLLRTRRRDLLGPVRARVRVWKY